MNKETKVVKYLGQIYEVPLWAAYIAGDLDGDVCVYEEEPKYDDDSKMYCVVNGKYLYVYHHPSKIQTCVAI